MPRAKKPQYFQAKYSFPVTEDGIAVDSVAKGERFSPDHPFVERFKDHLEPVGTFGRGDTGVEQATAAPGETRADEKAAV
jgi:hypothetical protein